MHYRVFSSAISRSSFLLRRFISSSTLRKPCERYFRNGLHLTVGNLPIQCLSSGAPRFSAPANTAQLEDDKPILEEIEKLAASGTIDKLIDAIKMSENIPIINMVNQALLEFRKQSDWETLAAFLEQAAAVGLLNDISRSKCLEEAIINCGDLQKSAAIIQILAKYNLDPSPHLLEKVSWKLEHFRMLKELLVMVDTLREHKYHPSETLYHRMLHLCHRGGHWQLSMQIFGVMDSTLGRQMTQHAYDIVLRTLEYANQHDAILTVLGNFNKRCSRRHALEVQTHLNMGNVKGALETVRDAHKLSVNMGESIYMKLMKQMVKEGMTDDLEALVLSTINQSKGNLKGWSRAVLLWLCVSDEARAQMVVVDKIRFGIDPWQMCFKTILGLEQVHLKEDSHKVIRILDEMNTDGKLQTLPGLLSAISCLAESNNIDKALELFEANVIQAITHTNTIVACDSSYATAFANPPSRLGKKAFATSSPDAAASTDPEKTAKQVEDSRQTRRKYLWAKRLPTIATAGAAATKPKYNILDLADPSLRDLWMRVIGELFHLAKKVGRSHFVKCRATLEKYFDTRTIRMGVYHELVLHQLTFRQNYSTSVNALVDLIMKPPPDILTAPWTAHYNMAMSACLLSSQPERVPKLYDNMCERAAIRKPGSTLHCDCAPNVRSNHLLLEAWTQLKNFDAIVNSASTTAKEIVNTTHEAGSLTEDLTPEEEWRRKRANFVVINILDRGFNIVVDRVLKVRSDSLENADLGGIAENLENAHMIFSAIEEVGFKQSREDLDRMLRALLRGWEIFGPQSGWLELAVDVFQHVIEDHRPFAYATASKMLDAAIASGNDDILIEVWSAAPECLLMLAASPKQIRHVTAVLYRHKMFKSVIELFTFASQLRDTIGLEIMSDTRLWGTFIRSVLHEMSPTAITASSAESSSAETEEHYPEAGSASHTITKATEPFEDLYFALDGASDLRLLLDPRIPNVLLEQLLKRHLVEPAIVLLELIARDRAKLMKPRPARGPASPSLSAEEELEQKKFNSFVEQLGKALTAEENLTGDSSGKLNVHTHDFIARGGEQLPNRRKNVRLTDDDVDDVPMSLMERFEAAATSLRKSGGGEN